jgi:hypothetical protein
MDATVNNERHQVSIVRELQAMANAHAREMAISGDQRRADLAFFARPHVVRRGASWQARDDIHGWLSCELSHEGWVVINPPGVAGPNEILGRKEGEPWWPARFNPKTPKRIRAAMGSPEAISGKVS